MKYFFMLVVLVGICGCSKSSLPWSIEKQKKYAIQLQEKGLYRQAAAAYSELADKARLTDSERAGVYFRAATICFEDMHDYESALRYYMKADISGARGEADNTIKRRIVECLERLGKPYDAQKELDRHTLTREHQPLAGETVVAHIGARKVTMNEVNDALRMLPEYVHKEYTAKDKKLEFLRHYIATELLYDSALRKGFDRNPDITRAAEQMKKNLMVEALLSEELAKDIAVTDTEVSLYFQAHQDEYKGKKLDDVRNEIAMRVSNEKKQNAYTALMDRLMHAEKVVIYNEYFVSDK